MATSLCTRRALAALLSAAITTFAVAAPPRPATRVMLPADVTPVEYRLDIAPDVAAMTFEGHGEIDIDVHRATRRIVVNALELKIAEVRLDDRAEAPRVTLDTATQTATFTWRRPVPAGRHRLALTWRGRILDHTNGLFLFKYLTPQGERGALYTQFENADARRPFPGWDEPARKAVFRLSATIPAGEMGVSNMPVEDTQALPDGRQHLRFAPTPRMSSYLLFFAAGDFERIHREVRGVDVGVVVKRGDTARAGFALDTAVQILPYYIDYFDTPYPLPKLDLVAAPGRSGVFGAMENWGAILCLERFALVDPDTATQSDRRDVYVVIAHEMAHQWFGDLVTMAWWDGLWLNEGFASWMEDKAAEHFHPEWNPWLDALAYKEYVMGTDARLGTHPVVTPIADVLQAGAAFDGITYTKGQQTIRTLEAWTGEDAFRDGVRRYMKRFAYGNTVSDDLYRAIDEGGGRPVAAIAHDLTLQAGVPMVVAGETACVDGRTQLTLSQDRFAIDAQSTTARRWHLPVAVALAGVDAPPVRVLLDGPTPRPVALDGCGPVVLNAGQSTYARSLYPADGFAAVLTRYAALAPADQLGILNDTVSLALQGRMPASALVAVLAAVPRAADPEVLQALSGHVMTLDRLYDGLPGQAAWRAFAQQRLRPLLDDAGTRARPGDSDNTVSLRAALLRALGRLDDPAVLADARTLMDGLAADPPVPLDPELRDFALSTMALHADAATWDTLHRLALAAPTALIRQDLYERLAAARDPALARRALDLALGDEPPRTELQPMLYAIADQHPALAFDDVTAHWSEVSARLDRSEAVWFVPALVQQSPDATLASRLRAFGEAHIPASARGNLERALATMRYRRQVRDERLPELTQALAARAP